MTICPEARATRCVSAFDPTSTISACPAASKWVSFLDAICKELARIRSYHSTMLFRSLILLLMCLVPRAVAEGLPDLGDASQGSFTPLEERRLGEEIMREVRADHTYYDDPESSDYLRALGNRLVVRGADSRQPFTFFLMQDRSINAFALPGAFIGVHTGLITAAQSESELAGVLAHEIAHVTQNHIARIISQQKQGTVIS